MQSHVGTPWYTAPEVLLRDYTQKCDIWSAGVMLYVMLVGFPPFFSQTELEINNEILNGNYDFSGKFVLILKSCKWTSCLDEEWEPVSEEAKHLITCMLNREDMRPTAAQIMKHNWFKVPLNNQLSSNALLKLTEFSSSTKIR